MVAPFDWRSPQLSGRTACARRGEKVGDFGPLCGGALGGLGAGDESGDFVSYPLGWAVVGEPADRLCRTFAGDGEAAVRAVAFHRSGELFPGLGGVLGDDVQQVRLAAAGHADVDGRRAGLVGEQRVRGRDGRALGAVGVAA